MQNKETATALDRIEKLLLNCAVVAVIALCLMITGSVIARALFNMALPDSITIVRELMVVAIVLPLASATATRSHIAVEFLANKFPKKVQAWLILFGTGVGLLALLPLIYAGGRELIHTVTSGGYFYGDLDLPKWPGRAVFLIGVFICWLRLLVLAYDDVKIIRSGDTSTLKNA